MLPARMGSRRMRLGVLPSRTCLSSSPYGWAATRLPSTQAASATLWVNVCTGDEWGPAEGSGEVRGVRPSRSYCVPTTIGDGTRPGGGDGRSRGEVSSLARATGTVFLPASCHLLHGPPFSTARPVRRHRHIPMFHCFSQLLFGRPTQASPVQAGRSVGVPNWSNQSRTWNPPSPCASRPVLHPDRTWCGLMSYRRKRLCVALWTWTEDVRATIQRGPIRNSKHAHAIKALAPTQHIIRQESDSPIHEQSKRN